MKSVIKSSIALIISIMLVVTFMIGCVNQPSSQTTTIPSTTAGTTASATTTETEGSMDKKLELTWLYYGDLTAYVEGSEVETALEEKFNVDLKSLAINATDAEKLNTTLASGMIPDVMCLQDPQKKFADGLIREIPMELVNKYMPFTVGKVTEIRGPIAWDNSKDYQTGKLIQIPGAGINGLMRFELALRKDWLEKVGLKAPETIDEFYEVMKAFTFNDPDGNGKDDTYGMSGAFENKFWLYGCLFGAYGVSQYGVFIEENGQVVNSYVSNGYKECLKFINKLYDDKLLDPEFVTDKEDQWLAKFLSGKNGLWEYPATTLQTGILQQLKDKNPAADLVFLEKGLKGPEGKSGAFSFGSGFWGMMFRNGLEDEKMIRAMQIAEGINSDFELFKLSTYGPEGKYYNVNANGSYTFKEGVVPAAHGLYVFRFPLYSDWDEVTLIWGNEASKIIERSTQVPFIDSIINNSVLMSIVGDKADLTEMNKINDQFFVDAITGKVDIDSGWDAYVQSWMDAGGQILTEEARKLPLLK